MSCIFSFARLKTLRKKTDEKICLFHLSHTTFMEGHMVVAAVCPAACQEGGCCFNPMDWNSNGSELECEWLLVRLCCMALRQTKDTSQEKPASCWDRLQHCCKLQWQRQALNGWTFCQWYMLPRGGDKNRNDFTSTLSKICIFRMVGVRGSREGGSEGGWNSSFKLHHWDVFHHVFYWLKLLKADYRYRETCMNIFKNYTIKCYS